MKAAVLNQFGKADELQLTHINQPRPGAGEVLIKIKAVGINPVDTKVRAGTNAISKRIQLPAVLGWDVSGIIEACGENVEAFKPGDAVFGGIGFPGSGNGYAEFAVASPDMLVKKPANITFEEAAAVPIAAWTAYQSVKEHLELQPGQKILIQAAAGGVGHFAVQFAKMAGAYVAGTASAGNADFLRSLGVDQVIDYKHQKFEEVVPDPDAVQDAMGGDVLYRSIGCVKQGGRVVCLPSSTRDDPKAIALAEERQVKLMWPMMRTDKAQLQTIAELLEQQKLKVCLDKVFALDEIISAHQAVESHHTVGKVVVRVNK